MKNIVIITSNNIRHNYFKLMLAHNSDINVLRTYVESDNSLDLSIKLSSVKALDNELLLHFDARHNTEYDFFSDIIELYKDDSKSIMINKGLINHKKVTDEIIDLNPDLIITYGCSIIKSNLLDCFKNRIINVHLGLSPYYFGSGTNFHCLVNNEFQFEGYTFMYMDEGVDTGNIIHQERAEVLPFDNPHQIGNRLIKQMTKSLIRLIVNFHLVEKKYPVTSIAGKTYKIIDATDESILKLYDNFRNNAVIDFLKNKESLKSQYPLVEQSFL